MMLAATKQSQRGITLIVGLIMLVLITLMVTTAFTLSNTNLKSVSNMQAKNEATAAASQVIEQILSSNFTNAPAAEQVNVDINADGTTDYVVEVATPTCVRASKQTIAVDSSSGLNIGFDSSWNTIWDVVATVDDAKTGAKTSVRAGLRVLLTDAQKVAVCI